MRKDKLNPNEMFNYWLQQQRKKIQPRIAFNSSEYKYFHIDVYVHSYVKTYKHPNIFILCTCLHM